MRDELVPMSDNAEETEFGCREGVGTLSVERVRSDGAQTDALARCHVPLPTTRPISNARLSD